jgi:type IX secretion system PorP/SprF family membrane protein
MLYRIIFTLTFLAFSLNGWSQQESQYSNHAFNPYYLNPAAGGLYNVMQFELVGRTQWLGYSGSPRTFMAMGNSQIKVGEEKVLDEYNNDGKALFALPNMSTGSIKHIVGGRAMNDAIGPFTKTSVYGSYAVHLPLIGHFNFGAGLGLGWSNFRVDDNRVVLYQDDDISYNTFLGNTAEQNMADVNAGIVLYDEHFFFGLSTSQLLNTQVQFADVNTESTHSRHYFLVSRYKFDLEHDYSIEPSVVGKMTPNAPVSFDFGARFIFNHSSWFGVQYRTSNAVVFQVGSTIVKNMYLGYNYEQSIGPVQSSGNGTHEIQLGFLIGNNRNIDKEIKDNKKDAESADESEE